MDNKKIIHSQENFYTCDCIQQGEFDDNGNLINGTIQEERKYNHKIFGTDQFALKIIKTVTNYKAFEEVKVEYPAFYFEGIIRESPEKDNAISPVNGKLIFISKTEKYTYLGEFSGFNIYNGDEEIQYNLYTIKRKFINGQPSTKEALISFNNGATFYGTFTKQEKMLYFDSGKYTACDGKTIYEGKWQDNKIKNGTILQRDTEVVYTEYYKNFNLESVKKEYSSGIVYEGKIDDKGNKTVGKTIYPNGMALECSNSQELTDDNATITTFLENQKIVYNGAIKKGKKNGKGTICSYVVNGNNLRKTCQYNGEFVDDVFMSGSLTEYDNGKQIEYSITLTKQQDKFVGEMVSQDKSFRYSGEFLNGMLPHGKGVLQEDDSVYEGNFVNGVKFGKGKLTTKSGEVIVGEWENDQLKIVKG